MRKYLHAALVMSFTLIASGALARGQLEIASIKAATDCVAQAALNNPNISALYQQTRLKEITDEIVLKSSACENALLAMRLLHDQLYGSGTGQVFLRGDYLADLPRAVRERIKPVLGSGIVARGPDANGSAPTNGTLILGTELRVVGIPQNDALNVREYPSASARIIAIIPPDTSEGLTYYGESHGEWVLVQFQDRLEGWVNRRFVGPALRRGRTY